MRNNYADLHYGPIISQLLPFSGVTTNNTLFPYTRQSAYSLPGVRDYISRPCDTRQKILKLLQNSKSCQGQHSAFNAFSVFVHAFKTPKNNSSRPSDAYVLIITSHRSSLHSEHAWLNTAWKPLRYLPRDRDRQAPRLEARMRRLLLNITAIIGGIARVGGRLLLL